MEIEEETPLRKSLIVRRQLSPDIPAAVTAWRIIGVAISLLVFYLFLGVLLYMSCPGQFYPPPETSETMKNQLLDALYFSIVTLCTVGYGDIVPDTCLTKFLTTLLVILGFACLDYLLNCFLSHVLDLQEKAILARITRASFMIRNREITEHLLDEANGKIKINWKLSSAFGLVFSCVVAGTLFLHIHEGLCFVDSFYLSVISVTTVGYGDIAFKTTEGKIFAAGWLLVSSIAMASLIYYLAEKRIDASLVKFPTTTISESDYIVRKLIETRKISEDEIKLLSNEYDHNSLLEIAPHQDVDDGVN